MTTHTIKPVRWLSWWKERIQTLRVEARAFHFVARDPRVGWPIRLLALTVVAYALSPIDLIPDWIPIIGYLDDLILIPLGVLLVIKLTPPAVLHDAREYASTLPARLPTRLSVAIIVTFWLIGAGLLTACFVYWLKR